MSQANVSNFIINRMLQWGIHRVFGYSGDGINGMMGALNEAAEHMEFIQVRHEESASLMACGHAKFTGETGVCIATAGPGAIHLLNGLYDAKMDHQPVVAIVGQKARRSMGSGFLQECDLHSLFKDVGGAYSQTINTPEQAPHVIDSAFRIARDRRTVAVVILPSDVQTLDMPAEQKPVHGGARSAIGYESPNVIPPSDQLDAAAALLNSGRKVAILAGAGCFGAENELLEIAQRLNASVTKALLGKALLPDDLPFVTGCHGLLGTEASYYAIKNCDTFLMIGTSFPYTDFLPDNGQAKGIQIDIEGGKLSVNYPMDVNLCGDAKSTLRALLERVDRKPDREWLDKVTDQVDRWWKKLKTRAYNEADPINPQRLFWELSDKLPDKSIICADAGTAANWFARDIKIRRGMKASLSGKLATMAPAIPYGIAAKFAYPDRVPVALIGDGAMQMLGMSNLITIAKYWRQWEDPRFVILVLNNRDLAQVTWEMRAMEGDPKFEASQNIPDVPYAKFARDLGLAGTRIDQPEYISEAWEQAFSAQSPFVIDAVTDPNVPTIPPHISFSQASNMIQSSLKGDPDRSDMVKQTAKDLIST